MASEKFAHTLCFMADMQTIEATMSPKDAEREWAEKAQRFVKAELKRANLTYEDLATRLRAMGLRETKVSIASKLSRAGFSAPVP